ncbi:MAG: response regulator [Proteobacteria bacterium]|nr:response regulator [Pseudomonadota bacterium]
MAARRGAASREGVCPVVLIVEDDELIRIEVAERLERSGFSVMQAPGAEEAIRLLTTTSVDLVFSDVDMPGRLDGRGLVNWLRREHPRIPALLASGSPQRRDDDPPLLAKPYRASELISTIRELLAHAERQHAT